MPRTPGAFQIYPHTFPTLSPSTHLIGLSLCHDGTPPLQVGQHTAQHVGPGHAVAHLREPGGGMHA